MLTRLTPATLALAISISVGSSAPDFINFETAPIHPIDLSPNAEALVVVNLPDARLEVFNVTSSPPILASSIAVGIDPVTARFRNATEVWVANHISSTINIIDLTTQQITQTIDTPLGPSDIVFAGNPEMAYVSCARNNQVLVIEPDTKSIVRTIPISGQRPKAMAVSPDGSTVYVAIFESGNASTIMGERLIDIEFEPRFPLLNDTNNPAGARFPPPNDGDSFHPPLNTALGLGPPVSHIVKKNIENRWSDDNSPSPPAQSLLFCKRCWGSRRAQLIESV